MVETFTFNQPFFLLFIPLFLWLNYAKSPKCDAYYFPHLQLYTKDKTKTTLLHTILKYLLILFAIISLADPIISAPQKSIKKNAIDIMIALDTSGSMSMYGFDTKEYNKTRLDVVKEVVTSFIKKRPDDRIGLVVFGTYSSIISPLSFDKKPQIQLVQGLEIGRLGKSTALVDALVSSIKALKESNSKSKIIILLSDGEDSSSKIPLTIALKLAKKHQIKIYTIIIDKSNNDMMKIIAKASHTQSYNPKDKTALEKVYRKINTLEKSTLEYATISLAQHIYRYFLSLCLNLTFLFRP
jgi:Ca-activated chloride channel family protein